VYVYASTNTPYVNKAVFHAIFTRIYLGHVGTKVEKHCLTWP